MLSCDRSGVSGFPDEKGACRREWIPGKHAPLIIVYYLLRNHLGFFFAGGAVEVPPSGPPVVWGF